MDEKQIKKTMDAALNYLSYKDRTSMEIQNYLRKKNYEEVIVKEVIRKLEEYHYVDDEKYLEHYLFNNRSINHFGSKRMRYDLKRRGIDEALLENLELLFPEQEEEKACEIIAKKNLEAFKEFTLPQQKKKLYDKLGRMGYPSQIISKVLRDLVLNENFEEKTEEELAFQKEKLKNKVNQDYEKYLRNYTKKGFEGRALEERIIKGLLGKGYAYDLIKETRDEKE